DQFTDALHAKKPGDKVSIVIDRDGKEKTLSARLISRQQMLQSEEDHDQNNQMSSNDRFRNDQNRHGQFRNDQNNRFAGNRQAPPNRAWLGVRMQNGESEQQPEGVWVERVFPNGPAHRAGIQQGDEILAIDGQRVNSAEEVGEVLDQHEGEHRLSFEVVRNGNRRNLSVTLGNADDWEHHFYQSGYGNQEQQSGYANQEQFQGGYDQGNAMHQHATMMTDYMRHHGMQNQRLEERLDMLMNEVQQLRRQVHELQQNQNNNR
ncbi:MAG TPA: PDZ domain-containing protein, partial [Planctomycetaceae bacterium]|nr:PDZ domain-containing protein [Planctomycetaceae bacterium]